MANQMRKKRAKPKTGAAKNYITRTQAVRRLQISLPDFRRLCIFKGIYPREPRNKRKIAKGSTPSTTFYYTKDIQYLQHEPLLEKFRDHKALAKKIGRALGRNDVGDAVRLDKNKARITLDHLVKERYPTFVDALRDLDDALSMLFLFASLPSHAYVPPKTIARCQRLVLEFQHYLIVSRSLRKSFLSIKGIYYQATIQGQDIMWLVPYKFVQKAAGDIDFRIMATFVEFYTTLLGFVNYRLYTNIGLVYPPKFDATSDEKGGELGAYSLQGKAISEVQNGTAQLKEGEEEDTQMVSSAAQDAADKVAELQNSSDDVEEPQAPAEEEQNDDQKLDKFETVTAQDADELLQPQLSSKDTGNLFADTVFFLSRETPKTSLEFLLKSFGGKRIGWDITLGDGAFTNDEKDPRITHQVVDRPAVLPTEANDKDEDDEDEDDEDEDDEEDVPRPAAQLRIPGRTYIQPQWVWDSVNQGKLLRPDLYAPGASLPPHLSPWMKPKAGMYDPTMPLEAQEQEGEADLYDSEDEEAEDAAAIAASGQGDAAESSEDEDEAEDDEVVVGEGMLVDDSDDDSSDVEITEVKAISKKDDVEGESDEEESADEQDEYQRELEAEAAGRPYSKDAVRAPEKKSVQARKKRSQKEKAEKEELDRQRMMMSNKKRKLFDKMNYGNKRRDSEAEKLREKRRKIEKAKSKQQAA